MRSSLEPGADIPSEMVGFEILALRLGSLQPEAAYSLTVRRVLPLVWASDVGVITGGRDKRPAARGAEEG